ncbi:MAG: rod shape-determining protein [Candidatus Moranbacteria bacterium]|nr:rod shape-determining protein [Candidatus Moranbacteria bacterium]
MGFFSKITGTKKTDEYYLALDIGTDLVKAIIFKIDQESEKGIVVGVGRKKQKTGDMQSGAISNIEGVIKSCNDAIETAKEQAGIKKIKHAVLGIAGELVKGTTTTVHYERARPHDRISMPELKNIIQKIQWKAYERIREQIEWEIGQPIDVKLINAAVVDVRIDGYRVANPINFQGKSVSMSIFNAYAPMIHLGAVDTIAEELNLDVISVVAEPYAVSMSVGYKDILDFSGIFVDIGGGTTDVAVVRNGGLEGTKMFALGGRAFTKRLARDLRITFDDAEDLKIKYGQGLLSGQSAQQINQIILQDSYVWLGGIELSLNEFAETDSLPSNIYLCGGGSALPEIKQVLMDGRWHKSLPFAKMPTVSFLQPRDVIYMLDQTGELNSPQDVTPLALANLMVGLSNEERVLAQILRRAMYDVQD